MEPATLDAVLTILALAGVALVVLLTERVLARVLGARSGSDAVPAPVAVTPAPDPVPQRPGH